RGRQQGDGPEGLPAEHRRSLSIEHHFASSKFPSSCAPRVGFRLRGLRSMSSRTSGSGVPRPTVPLALLVKCRFPSAASTNTSGTARSRLLRASTLPALGAIWMGGPLHRLLAITRPSLSWTTRIERRCLFAGSWIVLWTILQSRVYVVVMAPSGQRVTKLF